MAFGKQRWHGTVIATLVANPLDRKNAEREILIGLSGAKRNGYVLKWHPQPAAGYPDVARTPRNEYVLNTTN
jgi:hypothetical protein